MATIETKEVTINGSTFSIEHFGGKKGIPLMRRVIQLVSPVLHVFYQAHQENDVPVMLGCAAEVIGHFEDDLIENILANTTKDKYMINIDRDFADEYDTLILLILEVIKFNWGKSFTRLLASAPSAFGES